MSDVVSVGLFLFLYYLSLCVMSGADTVLVEMGGSAPFLDEELPHGTGRPCIPDSGGATQVCRLGRATPYLQTGLETGLCLYKAWQMSPMMGAWPLDYSPGQRDMFTFSSALDLS